MHDDLAKEFVEFMDTIPDNSPCTWDDFFDHVEVPPQVRNDFLIGCILKQATEKYGFNK